MNTMRVVEIRSYQLRPGSSAAFHSLVAEQSVPLLRAAGIDVVAYGASLHQADAYVLIRAFDSMEHLHKSQDSFYASPAWRQGPRESIIALIESDANAVLQLGANTVEGLRGCAMPAQQ
ncbi:NIPSNAP family protein [Rhodoferax sp.]|uniref:NIPSNAP family protein n=1 Tax=Rhodoferax sp. TaxID=50421 RepID=UPI0025E6DA1A|nr:NIPSNAP family protein [Rhodoferax sp.]